MSRIPKYIAIEGPIGVGKTTLVNSIARQIKARTVLEQFEENPFLPMFYEDQNRFAFQTELYFLLSRFRQQEAFVQEDLFQQHTVSDYIFTKCWWFASLTLSNHDLALFEHTFRILERYVPTPDLLIFLHAPVDILQKRIYRRGREYEQGMEEDYLKELCNLYVRETSSSIPEENLIIIDTNEIDFRHVENVQVLLKCIEEGKRGRLSPELFHRNMPHLTLVQNNR